MQIACWILTLIGSLIGGVFVFSSFVEKAAPQQAAAAAIGVGFGVLPYCFARAVSELARLNAPSAAVEEVAGAVQCPSCGKRIRPRPGEAKCYLCGGALAAPAT